MAEVNVTQSIQQVRVEDTGDVVQVQIAPPPYVRVEIGDTGPQGPAGVSTVAFHYVQSTASDVWTIAHGLGWNPNATVVDSAGTNCEGEIQYLDSNTLRIIFTGAFSGDAYLS